jgi:site-specific recombinase XerD
MRISFKSERATISTGRSIKSKFWNSKKESVKPGHIDADTINDELNSLRNDVHGIRSELQKTRSAINPQEILILLQSQDCETHHLIDVYSKHNTRMDSMLGKGYAASYFKNHKSTKKHLEEFIQLHYKINDIPIKDVDNIFIENFVHFLRTEKNNNHNGAMKNLVRLKKIIRLALHNEWLDKDPFIHHKMTFQKYDRIYLNQDELEILESTELKTAKLNKVRDMFVFSCYTGLAYADIKNLQTQNIVTGIDGNEWISANRKKSGIRFTLPLLPKALEIMQQYKSEVSEGSSVPLFPIMSNQKMNQYLKDVAKFCGITKPITFHSARHTFATTVTLVNGVPIETVSKMLGHTDLSTTQIYARVIDEKIATDMQVLQEKLK